MSKNLMPPNGGKAYLMLLEDIRDLASMVEYRNNPNLQISELKGFEAPPFMISKIRAYVDTVCSDRRQGKNPLLHHNLPNNETLECFSLIKYKVDPCYKATLGAKQKLTL